MAREVALTAVDAQPNECALAAPLRVTWEFTTSQPLAGACWEVTYVVDVAEHQRELPLGRTLSADYAAGACAAEFACDAIDVAGVPLGWLNNVGLLKLALRDADGAEVHVSSLLTQVVRARPRLLRHVLRFCTCSCFEQST